MARGFALTQLVDDLARLGVDRGVVLVRLELGEHLECAVRELRPEEERLQARDQRVAAEDRHEPGHPGRRQLSDRRVAAADAKRGQIGHGLREGMRELLPARANVRHAELPRSE